MAVLREWKSVEDCVSFWLADHEDDTSDKVVLMYSVAETMASLCLKCKPPKE
jgi:hypothetical protein